jgi:hypothetical protein
MGRRPRICTGCGGPYWRANRVRLWTTQNPGHRDGWQKVDDVYCTNCVPATLATRILGVTQIRIVNVPRARRRRRRA